jgi:hypothetical protein
MYVAQGFFCVLHPRTNPGSTPVPAQGHGQCSILERERHVVDQGTDPFECLGLQRDILKGLGQLADLLAIDSSRIDREGQDRRLDRLDLLVELA